MTLDDDAFAEEADELEAAHDAATAATARRAVAVVDFVARSLSDDPAAVSVDAAEGRRGEVALAIRAGRGDVGRLIGRRGRTIQALRQVARAAASLDGVRISVDVED